jgi:hypothetical protein
LWSSSARYLNLPLLECALLVAILDPWNAKYRTHIN